MAGARRALVERKTRETDIRLADGLANGGQTPLTTERRVEAELALAPRTSRSAGRVPRLMWEGRREPAFGSRVDRDVAERVAGSDQCVPSRCRSNETGCTAALDRKRDDPLLRLLVELQAVLYRARGEPTKATKTSLDRRRWEDGRRIHAKRPLPGVAGPVGGV